MYTIVTGTVKVQVDLQEGRFDEHAQARRETAAKARANRPEGTMSFPAPEEAAGVVSALAELASTVGAGAALDGSVGALGGVAGL